MADLTKLQISITVTGKEKAVSDIKEVGTEGTKVSQKAVKVRVDTSSIDQAIAKMKEFEKSGQSGVFNVKASSMEEHARYVKQAQVAMDELGNSSSKIIVTYNAQAEAAKKAKEEANSAATQQKNQQQILGNIAKDVSGYQKTQANETKKAAKAQADAHAMGRQQAMAIAEDIKRQETAQKAANKAQADAEKATKQHADALAKQKGMIRELNDHFLRMARIVASVAVAFYLFRGAINIFQQLLDTVDEFNTTTIGIASTMTDMAKDQSNPQQNFVQNLSYAKDMYVELENAAAKYFASGQELVQGWNILTQQGIVLQKDQIDNLGVIVDKIKLLTQGQTSSVQIAQELRAALMGQARPTDQLARIIKDRVGGAWKEVFAQVKQTQSLDPIAKMFSGLEIARPLIQETMMAQLETLWTNLRQITRMGMLDPYRDVVEYLKEWNAWLKENKEYVGERLAAAWDKIKIALQAIERILIGIIQLVHDPILLAILGGTLGGMAFGHWGAAAGAMLGFAAATGTTTESLKSMIETGTALDNYDPAIRALTSMIEAKKKEIEITKEAAKMGLNLDPLAYGIEGIWDKAEEAAKNYEKVQDSIAAKKAPKEPMLPTEMVQRPVVWSDASVKALQSASSLLTAFNSQLSSMSESGTTKIASDFAKMTEQIDKAVYKMKQEADSIKLAVEYEQKLKGIRDQIIAQEFEKQNREFYAFSLEGVPETLENQLAKFRFGLEEAKRKFATPTQKTIEDLVSGDPILRMVESAKNADDIMRSSAERMAVEWKKQIANINYSLDAMIDKLEKLGAVPTTGNNYLEKYLSTEKGIKSAEFTPFQALGSLNPLGSYLGRGSIIGSDTVEKLREAVKLSTENDLKNTPIQINAPSGSIQVSLPPGSVKIGAGNDRSIRNNNPGNLNYATWEQKYGAVMEEPVGWANPAAGKGGPRFAKFPTPEAGYEALLDLVERYQAKNLSITQTIEKYAPRGENKNVDERIRQMSIALQVSPETNIAELPRNKIAEVLAAQDSGTRLTGEFSSLQGKYGVLRGFGGITKEQSFAQKEALGTANIIAAHYMKMEEALKGAYSSLAAMNIPAEQQNEYAQKAVELEVLIDQQKIDQFVRTNGITGALKDQLIGLTSIQGQEKLRLEAINNQIRPLEEQKELLSQQQTMVSNLGSSSLFASDQLNYQRQALSFQQQIARIELQEWIVKNDGRLKLSESQKETLRNLLQQQQINERIAQIRKDWTVQGIPGGVKEFALQQVIDSKTYLSTSMNQFLQDMKSTMSDQMSSIWIEFANSGRLSFTALGEAFRDRFIKLAMDLIVNQLWTALSQILIQSVGILGSFGGGGGGSSLVGVSNAYSFSGLFGSSRGNVFSSSGLVPFRSGGIVSKPTLFPFASGTGLMGEAGPEAILPLVRTSGGDLGVKSSGDSKPQVNVIINNNSKNTQADAKQDSNGDIIVTIDEMMGKAIARRGSAYKAVQSVGSTTRR